jgi:hypothetical protein
MVNAGVLTVADIRHGDPAACTLLPGAVSPVPVDPARKPVPVAPAESPDEGAELLCDLVIALLDLPDDAWPALPDELRDRLERYFEVCVP